jgi:hypothetical protein
VEQQDGFIPFILAYFLFFWCSIWIFIIHRVNPLGIKIMAIFIRILFLLFICLLCPPSFASTSWMGGTNNRCEQVNPGHTCYRFEQTQACGAGFCRYKDGSDCSSFVGTSDEWLIEGWGSSVGCCAAPMVVNPATSACECPAGKIEKNGSCIDPPSACQYPKEDDGNGGCKCPEGQIEDGEVCKPKPDCPAKSTECSDSCSSAGKAVGRFFCEESTPSDPTTQLFSGVTYSCSCVSIDGCPVGQSKVLSSTGLESCRPSGDKKCPAGSFYGEFQGVKGCIEPTPRDPNPDMPPNNCIAGTNPVYHGSALYCVPPPNSDKTKTGNEGGCPAGTAPTLTNGTYLCKNPDGSGRTGSNSNSGSNSGSGIGSSDASIAAVGAVEQQLKENGKADEKANAENNKELKDLNSKLFSANQTLQQIKDKIPSEIKSEEESPINSPETLKTALDAAIDRLADAPIISAALDVLGQFPDSQGSCPVIAFSFWGRDISSDLHCQLFEDVKPNLEAVMFAFWSIFAVFVFRRMS